MEFISLSKWLSEVVNESHQLKNYTDTKLPISIWDYILEFSQISLPNWREKTPHSIIFKAIIPETKLEVSKIWYGHYWSLKSIPWICTYWYGLRGLESELFPMMSPHNYKVRMTYINENESTYLGYDDLECPFALIETFPEWCLGIIKKVYSLPDISLRQCANIYMRPW
tara:strand:- start:73 stop:579 length:507 start_codon:yes stop_codon:yes gene_type:complete